MTTSISEIRRHAATQRRGYERFLDFFANYVVKIALFCRLTPTQLTFFWVIVQFFAPLFFTFGSYFSFVLGIVLFQCMFIVDLSDGKLFRFSKAGVKHKKPLFPKYLDHLGHYINNAWLFICLGLGTMLRYSGDWFFFYGGLAAAFFYLLNKSTAINPAWYKSFEEQKTILGLVDQATPRYGKSLLKQFLFDFFRVEHLGNFLFFGILFDQPGVVLMVYAGLFCLEFLRKLYVQGKLLWRVDKGRS
ncbi:MAG TPA: hypothetical protein VJC21_06095 [Candidatus Nanoarchaeia archaeon]|nr:hypothetical protein [Candidatus Nanoarchaeia archaeon]